MQPVLAGHHESAALSQAAVPDQVPERHSGGGQYLPDLPVVDRPMTYIPAAAVDDTVAGLMGPVPALAQIAPCAQARATAEVREPTTSLA